MARRPCTDSWFTLHVQTYGPQTLYRLMIFTLCKDLWPTNPVQTHGLHFLCILMAHKPCTDSWPTLHHRLKVHKPCTDLWSTYTLCRPMVHTPCTVLRSTHPMQSYGPQTLYSFMIHNTVKNYDPKHLHTYG